ncbi:hypothetical protein Ga0466249_004032 [Sporomusaceae bacterium BoRhaA]|uniref:hypothetical protein n=1 Tax=Pelorhabdus rhamnosifermentans TaxID=2772457 RepID=UPI001C061AAB|nr:hypothetical protein [Pelorhabdus rhamnosifermentans]MBU2702897.1 hypothetical protein [Pelorhabdus rhamnosifermentans]
MRSSPATAKTLIIPLLRYSLAEAGLTIAIDAQLNGNLKIALLQFEQKCQQNGTKNYQHCKARRRLFFVWGDYMPREPCRE